MSENGSSSLLVDLSGQVALVTGASRGIGKAIALRLGQAGARVICAARNEEQLANTVGAIESAGGVAEMFPCDVTNAEAVDDLVHQLLERWESFDVLVNNAGITRDTLIPRMGTGDWDDVIRTNLRSVFLLTRAASRPMMQQRRGRIINISSVSGVMGNPGQANYAASKAGVIGMTRCVAKELASRKVTVNAICPGFIATEMTAALSETILSEVKKRVPAKRLGRPEEIADAVLYLASPAAAYVTGQVLTVDGGLSA